jgi:hypothetical protein
MNTTCERDDCAFMAVASHARAALARWISCAATSGPVTGTLRQRAWPGAVSAGAWRAAAS